MDPGARPRAVTAAGWITVGASVAVIVAAIAQVATLHSLDTREGLQAQLRDYGLHLHVAAVIRAIRVLSTVAAAGAAALAILGWYAMQGSRSARLGAAIVAVPLFVTGVATGALLSTAAVVGVVLLHLEPARSWFGGTTPSRTDRPPSLVIGVLMTWIGCLLTCVSVVAGVAVVLHDPQSMIDAAYRQNPELARQDATLTADALRAGAVLMGVLIIAWCVVAGVMAVLALRRVTWAWIVLLVQAGVAGAFLVLCSLLSPAAVIALVPCAGAFGALLNRTVRDWFDRRPTAPAAPPPGGWPPPR